MRTSNAFDSPSVAVDGSLATSSAPSISGNLARSSLINSAGQAIYLLLNLVVTRYIVGVLGLDAYGIWALVLAATGTASGLDFGMSMSVLRAVPRATTTGRHTRLAAMTGGVVIFYGAATLLFAVFATVAVILSSRLSFIRAELRGDVGRMAICSVILFAVSSAASITRALLQGLNRFDLSTFVTLASFPVFAVSAVVLVRQGTGFTGLTAAMAGMFVAQSLLSWYFIKRNYPECRLWSRFAFSRSIREELFRFGGALQVSAIADTLKMQLPKFLAAGLLGPAAAGLYDLGNRVANAGWGIPAALLPAVVPAASEMGVREKADSIALLFVSGTRALVMLALPLGFILALLSNDLIAAWLGDGNNAAAFVLLFLALGNVWHLATGVGTFIGRGIGKTRLELRFQLVSVVLYTLLSTIGALTLGLHGIAVGVALGSTIAAFSFGRSFSVTWGLDSTHVFVQVVVGPILTLIPAASLTLAVFVLTSRLDALRHLLLVGGVFGVTYSMTLVTLLLRQARPHDRGGIQNLRATLLHVLRGA